MEKEFVPYEVVKELSGIGFNEPCFAYYNRDKEIVMTNIRENYNKLPILSAPSFFEAYHWIRKNYPMYDGYYCYNNKENSLWAFNPQNLSKYISEKRNKVVEYKPRNEFMIKLLLDIQE
jgi:hypothetical protein